MEGAQDDPYNIKRTFFIPSVKNDTGNKKCPFYIKVSILGACHCCNSFNVNRYRQSRGITHSSNHTTPIFTYYYK